MDSEKTLLEEANLRVRALAGAILLAEVPETTRSIGVVEVSFDRTPSTEGSYYVVYDSELRHPYSPVEPGSPLPPEDLAVARAAVAAAAPDEPWVRYGLEREVTPLGFRPDGEPYTAEEAREALGKDFQMIGSELSHESGLSVTELIASVPMAFPAEELELTITNAILKDTARRAAAFDRYGDLVEDGGRLRVSCGQTPQGCAYKDPVAFCDRNDEPAYIPEAGFEGLREDDDGMVALDEVDPEEVYSYADILEAAQGSREMAELIFSQLDWQHPSTVYDENMRLLSEVWDDAPSQARVADLEAPARIYAECRLREAGLEGRDLERAMASTVAETTEAIGEPRRGAAAEPDPYPYRLLSRLKADCDYVLGAGGPGSVKYLWAGDVPAQIAKMREVYASLPEPPEWLSAEDIDRYERDMRALLEAQGKSEEARQEAVSAPKALDDAGLLDYFDFADYGRAAAQEHHLTDEGFMPASADGPSTDLYDREEIAELAREARGDARPVPLGSTRPAPAPYTPQADMRGVQAPVREAASRREKPELTR